jgi:hypothetical protein
MQLDVQDVSNRRFIDPPASDFWTVHLVGTPYRLDYWTGVPQIVFGWAPYDMGLPNTAFVFMRMIENYVENYNRGRPVEEQIADSIVKQYTVAHEIGHLLYVEHYSDPTIIGIMQGTLNVANLLNSDSDHRKFTVADLRAFQAIEKPR